MKTVIGMCWAVKNKYIKLKEFLKDVILYKIVKSVLEAYVSNKIIKIHLQPQKIESSRKFLVIRNNENILNFNISSENNWIMKCCWQPSEFLQSAVASCRLEEWPPEIVTD
jgi:hypothetical protein